MRFYLLLTTFLLISQFTNAQKTKKVLFIGNSYTAVNNLPNMVAQVALSMGDTLIYDSNTPGGYTFEAHSTNTTTIAKINANNWDYVVLQAQSQEPSFPPAQVEAETYPYADSLVRMIYENDSCTRVLFYMTWGRKNGDASNCPFYPVVCTYDGMQGRLRYSYLEMGTTHGAEVSPVGVVWNTIRDTYPLIELYQADESHPSLAGTYTAACTFYSAIFQKTIGSGAYVPSGLAVSDASSIYNTSNTIVFDSLDVWGIDTLTLFSNYSVLTDSAGYFHFSAQTAGNDSYEWTINGATYYGQDVYLPTASGLYDTQLLCERKCEWDSTQRIETLSGNIEMEKTKINCFPNPFHDRINFSTEFTGNIQVINSLGVIIHSEKIINSKSIYLGSLPAGIYTVNFIHNNGVSTNAVICE